MIAVIIFAIIAILIIVVAIIMIKEAADSVIDLTYIETNKDLLDKVEEIVGVKLRGGDK